VADGWTFLALDEVERRPWTGTELEWRPLREALGTRIVGMAAFTASRVGQELIEGHSEEAGGRGQEEVYVVPRGYRGARPRWTADVRAVGVRTDRACAAAARVRSGSRTRAARRAAP
jgi:hypothetical protein